MGNLPYSTSEAELCGLFSPYGKIVSCALPLDRETGRPRGFGFVELRTNEAATAIRALDGQQFGGRRLRVNEARPRSRKASPSPRKVVVPAVTRSVFAVGGPRQAPETRRVEVAIPKRPGKSATPGPKRSGSGWHRFVDGRLTSTRSKKEKRKRRQGSGNSRTAAVMAQRRQSVWRPLRGGLMSPR